MGLISLHLEHCLISPTLNKSPPKPRRTSPGEVPVGGLSFSLYAIVLLSTSFHCMMQEESFENRNFFFYNRPIGVNVHSQLMAVNNLHVVMFVSRKSWVYYDPATVVFPQHIIFRRHFSFKPATQGATIPTITPGLYG